MNRLQTSALLRRWSLVTGLGYGEHSHRNSADKSASNTANKMATKTAGMNTKARSGFQHGLLVASSLWVVCTLGLWSWMTWYQFKGDVPAGGVDSIREQVEQLVPGWQPGRSALAVFLHPKCPCSKATVNELDRMLDALATERQPLFVAVMACPASDTENWMSSPLVKQVSGFPSAQVVHDRGGELSAAFGVTTSGDVMLFDAWGERVFHGGVTTGRGHEGESIALSRIRAFLATNEAIPVLASKAPVFGCRLISTPSLLERPNVRD